MTEPNDSDTLLKRYLGGAEELAAAIAELTAEALDTAPLDGGWTIRQIVHHVADGDDLWAIAIKMALGSEAVTFDLSWYWRTPQDAWAENWRYASRATEPSLALLRAQRGHIAQLLTSIAGAWERTITIPWPHHPASATTVAEIIAMQTRHVYGHAADIRRIREAHGL